MRTRASGSARAMKTFTAGLGFSRTLIIAAALTLCARVALAESAVETWTVDGVKREAIVYTPKSTAGKAPLIFSFHGHGDDMENFQYVGLQNVWPDAIIVYFQGLPSRDSYRGWQVEPGEYGDRDLKMVDAVLAAMKKKYNVDDNRIYATGFSNGAHFTYLLWAARPNVFAAFAPVAGRIRPTAMPKEPRPILIIGGARDAQVAFPDQRAAMGIAIRLNGVDGKTASCGDGCTLYGGDTPAPVMTWIHQGGHEYPRPTSGKIAEFFHQHPKGE
jgi:polyhydroxybutyrate depolymerase